MKKLENVRELFKTLKHRKPTRICSPKIHPTSSFNNWLIPSKYVCSNCGYTGSIVMELEKEEEKSENKNA
jgi:hypothetical protein